MKSRKECHFFLGLLPIPMVFRMWSMEVLCYSLLIITKQGWYCFMNSTKTLAVQNFMDGAHLECEHVLEELNRYLPFQ